MTNIKTIETATARRKKGRDCWLWIVDRCPICGQKHTHGGGPLDGDPLKYLGHRVGHCQKTNGGYILVEAMQP